MRIDHLKQRIRETIDRITRHNDRNVLYYASAFLEKPESNYGIYTRIDVEDINGFMLGVHGLDYEKDLLLILHTPGGNPEAAQNPRRISTKQVPSY